MLPTVKKDAAANDDRTPLSPVDTTSNGGIFRKRGRLCRTLLEFAALLFLSSASSSPSFSASALSPPQHLNYDDGQQQQSDDPNRVLSRHRRFLFPTANGWVVAARFSLTVPIDSDVTGTMVFTFPFTYTLDTGV